MCLFHHYICTCFALFVAILTLSQHLQKMREQKSIAIKNNHDWWVRVKIHRTDPALITRLLFSWFQHLCPSGDMDTSRSFVYIIKIVKNKSRENKTNPGDERRGQSFVLYHKGNNSSSNVMKLIYLLNTHSWCRRVCVRVILIRIFFEYVFSLSVSVGLRCFTRLRFMFHVSVRVGN